MDVVAKPAATPHRTKRRGRHPDKALSAALVRTAPPGRHADGNGLYLFVQPSGTRSWVQRLVIRGRRRELGLGAATLVPLAKAREQALANRMLARSGGDPRRGAAWRRQRPRVPTRSGRAIAMSTLPNMLQYHEVAAVPHGFRSSFRDWAAERTDHPREVIEAALAHVVQNKVEAAYARSDLFERRRLLMDGWASLARDGR